MDVVVHLLALEQLTDVATVDIDLTAFDSTDGAHVRLGGVPRSNSASDFFEKAHKIDWVAHSNAFAGLDGETEITERAQDLRDDVELTVRYAPGGQLVGGAVDAALALFFGRPLRRELGTNKPVDRSINTLRDAGWSHGDLRGLLHKWAVLDPASAVVLLHMDHAEYAGAHHELMCRFDIVHSEYDFISEVDQAELQTTGTGSIQTMLLRADRSSFDALVDRNRAAVLGSYVEEFSVLPISVLWSPVRQSASDIGHQQRLRKLRRKELTNQLLEKARNR